MPDPGPSWRLSDFDLARDYRRFGLTESLFGAANPDLRRFKAAGGKLLIYQGWNDVLASLPESSGDPNDAGNFRAAEPLR